MTFRKGDVISDTDVEFYFKNLYLKVNDITYLQMNTLTTGQFLEESTSGGIDILREELNTTSNQYFDSMSQRGIDFLQYYKDQIELIQNK